MTICNEITVTVWFTVNKTPTGVLLIFLPPPLPPKEFHDLLTGKKIFNKNGVAQYNM